MNRYEREQEARQFVGELCQHWAGASLWLAHNCLIGTFFVLIGITFFQLPMLLPVAGFTAILSGALYLLAWALFGFPKAKDGRLGGSR